MPLRVEEYVREDGTVPFKDWFERLDPHAAAKVATAVTRLSLGNTSNVKWFSGIGELKVDWGPGYRVYLAKDVRRWSCCSAVARRSGSRPISPRR